MNILFFNANKYLPNASIAPGVAAGVAGDVLGAPSYVDSFELCIWTWRCGCNWCVILFTIVITINVVIFFTFFVCGFAVVTDVFMCINFWSYFAVVCYNLSLAGIGDIINNLVAVVVWHDRIHVVVSNICPLNKQNEKKILNTKSVS